MWEASRHDETTFGLTIQPVPVGQPFTLGGVTYSRNPAGPLAKEWIASSAGGVLRWAQPGTGFYVQCDPTPGADAQRWVLSFGVAGDGGTPVSALTDAYAPRHYYWEVRSLITHGRL